MPPLARDLPDAHVGVVARRVRQLAELQPEQAVGAGEGGLDHAVEREEGLECCLVEVVLGRAPALGVEAPVPGLQRALHPVLAHHALQDGGVVERLGAGGAPDAHQQRAHGLGRAGHLGLELVVGEGLEAQEPGALLAQRQDLGRDGAVVGLPAAHPPRGPRAPRPLARGSVGRELQERDDEGARERDHGAVLAALAPRGLGGGHHEARQAVAGVLGQGHGPGPLVGQEVLREAGAEHRQPLLDGGQPLAVLAFQRRAGAPEVAARLAQHGRLLGREVERLAALPQRLDPRPQRAVHDDLVAVGRHARGDVALQRLARGVRVGPGEVEEHAQHPRQVAARALHRLDRVGVGGRAVPPGDGLDLGARAPQRLLEGGHDVAVLDVGEGRDAEGRVPVREKGVHARLHRAGSGSGTLSREAEPAQRASRQPPGAERRRSRASSRRSRVDSVIVSAR